MLVRISGMLSEVGEEQVVVERDGLAYEVFVPRYTIGTLGGQRGQPVTLHTMQYLEGSPGGGNLIPRLIGFLDPSDRAFFEQFTTVKGVGIRRGLRALVEPVPRVARDIEQGDLKALARLPGIGPRMAQQIVAELRGKLALFARGAAAASESAAAGMNRPQRDAIELLVAWGDSRADAADWIQRAAQSHPDLVEVEEWVKAAYRVKSGAA